MKTGFCNGFFFLIYVVLWTLVHLISNNSQCSLHLHTMNVFILTQTVRKSLHSLHGVWYVLILSVLSVWIYIFFVFSFSIAFLLLLLLCSVLRVVCAVCLFVVRLHLPLLLHVLFYLHSSFMNMFALCL